MARPRGFTVSPELRNSFCAAMLCRAQLYAASPRCFFFFAAFSFRAEGLNTEMIFCMPPTYKYVHKKTTAKLKKMNIHMIPVLMSAQSLIGADLTYQSLARCTAGKR